MTHDEVEFLISQHLDGTLSADEAEKLRIVLEQDPVAKALFEEHQRLDVALKSTRTADLRIDQDWLTAQIAGAIDEHQSRPILLSNRSMFAPMAIAATLLIGLTLGVVFLKDETESPANQLSSNTNVSRIVEIGSPETPVRNDVAMANVSVGVPANLSPAMMTALFIADHRSTGKVVIKPAGEVRHGPFD